MLLPKRYLTITVFDSTLPQVFSDPESTMAVRLYMCFPLMLFSDFAYNQFLMVTDGNEFLVLHKGIMKLLQEG